MAARGRARTRTVLVQGEEVEQAITEYVLGYRTGSPYMVAGYRIMVIHVTGQPANIGEAVLRNGPEVLKALDVDFMAIETRSLATEDGEQTLHSFADAVSVLRQFALDYVATEQETREAAFQARLTHLIGE